MDYEEKELYESSRKKLLNFVDIKTLKEILNAFTMATDLTANIVDVEGKSIFSKNDAQKCCKFCRLIYSYKKGLERCQGAYKRAGKQSALMGKPYIFRCPAGLIEWAAPIIVNGEHLGNIICGQVLMWEPEEFFWLELREMNKSITSDFQDLFKAVEELPIISGEKVEAASYMLYVLANYIMKSGWENYNYIQEIEQQQSVLYEEIENRKKLETTLSEKAFVDNFVKENEFINNLKIGNSDEIKKSFRRLTTDIYTSSDRNIDIMKTKIVEILILTSRTIVQMGGKIEETSKINNELFLKISDMKSIEEICLLASNILNLYLKCLESINPDSSNVNVRRMVKYIQEHYKESLTLEMIASASYLSTSYASRIFKKVKNVSIMDYVTHVKMENAKRLLANKYYKIDAIAQEMGFVDSSYFTKVFKKYEGITPTQYRKLI